MAASFDLFLSYNTRDREAVLHVQEALRARGIGTFLDCQHLIAGLNWRDEIEAALTKVNSVAVFIGSEGFGRVQRNEKNIALDRQDVATQAGRKFPVIPILLPGANPEDVTGFLSQNTWIDLRSGLENAAAMDAIVRAIRGEAPAAPIMQPEPLCPYRGLLAFTEDDAPLFYGRDAFADDLLDKARHLKLIAVVGPSGTGKSSVVQAGLLPRLRRERAPHAQWEAIIFRPGNRPFHNLASELVALYEKSPSESDQMLAANKIGDALAKNELPLDVPIAKALKTAKWADRLLIIADQFEELFTLTEEKDRKPFVNLLLQAAETAPLTIVLTLRGDFYNQAISVSRELSDLMQQGIVNIGYVKREELRRAILEPAKTVGLQFEDGLVDRILDNLEDEPGNLPLLEFALTELWEKRQGNRVTNQLYEDIGGVAGSVGKRAEEVFTSLSPAQQNIALRAFTRLVRVSAASEEGTDTRQRVTLKEFNDATVLQPFVKARLLVTSRNEATGEEIVEVAHEALIKNWERLKELVRTDREFLLWRQEFNFLRAKWIRTQNETGNARDGLLMGNDLKRAKSWFKSYSRDLNDEEKLYIYKSEKAGTQTRKRIVVIGIFLLIGILGSQGWKAWDNRPSAQINKIIEESKSFVQAADYTIEVNDWLKSLVITNHTSEAIVIIDGFENIESRVQGMATVAQSLEHVGRHEEAKGFAQKAHDLVKTIKFEGYRAQSFASVSQALKQTGQEKLAMAAALEAQELAKSFKDPMYRTQALVAIAQVFVQTGQNEMAKEAAHEARSLAKSVIDIYSRGQTLMAVAQVFALAERHQDAKDVAMEARELGRDFFKDAYSKAQLLVNVAQILTFGGQNKEADDTIQVAIRELEGIKDIQYRANALAQTSLVLAQAGHVQGSLEAANRIVSDDSRNMALSTLSYALAQTSHLQEALGIAQSIQDTRYRTQALAFVAPYLARAGKIDDAAIAAKAALPGIKSIEFDISRIQSLIGVAQAFTHIGDFDSAKQTIDQAYSLAPMLTDKFKSSIYSDIAQTYAKLHDYRSARDIAKYCAESNDKLRAYTVILREYAIDKEKISPKLFEQLDRKK